MRVAAFDIGSNTLLMLLAEVGPDGAVSPQSDSCEFGRLGEGVAATGQLSDQAITRSLAILEGFAAKLKAFDAQRIGAVGTAALRVANNGAAFLAEAERILGRKVEIISGVREAELTFRATASAFPELAADVLVLADVGGASTESVVGRKGSIETAQSIPIGAVSLAEGFLHSDPPTAAESKALFAEIDSHLEELLLPSEVPLVGTAGTATTFASVELKLSDYDANAVQGLHMPRTRVEWHVATFLELTLTEKQRLPGLEPKRADVIAAGAAIYARIMARMKAPELITSGRGVRFGLAAELADELPA